MDEYINRTQAIVELRSGFFPQDVVYTEAVSIAEQILRSAPVANVVPKSKVDSEIEAWQDLYADTVSKWEKAYEELEIKLETSRAEVAREIFEEIERLTFSFGYGVRSDHTVAHTRSIDDDLLKELKKKYPEVKNDG